MHGPGPVVWLDDDLVDRDAAGVSPVDHAVTVGDGVFETLKLVGGRPFARTRHLRRLRRCGEAMGIEVPGDGLLIRATDAVCAANPPATRLRIVLSSGPGPAGSGRGPGPSTLVAFVDDTPLPAGPSKVITVPWTRNERGALAGLKSTSYAENVLALRRAKAAGGDEALFCNTRGELCEGTGTNIFVVLDGSLLTPPLDSGCLAGITRALTLEAGHGTEATIAGSRLADVTEAFLTSTTRDVQPIESIDGRRLPVVDGDHTRRAAEGFAAVSSAIDP